jgi:O-antigen chain-terminating methyltransferase
MGSKDEDQMMRKLDLRREGMRTLGGNDDDQAAGFSGADAPSLIRANRTAIAAMRKSQFIQTEWKLASHKKATGGLIVFVKRVIRKGIRWYVRPPLVQQSEFNRFVTEAVANLQSLEICRQEAVEQMQSEHARQIAVLEDKIDMLTDALSKAQAALGQKNAGSNRV